MVAACEGGGIGKDGQLPWRLQQEMKYFAKMTKATKDKDKKVNKNMCNAPLTFVVGYSSSEFKPLSTQHCPQDMLNVCEKQ